MQLIGVECAIDGRGVVVGETGDQSEFPTASGEKIKLRFLGRTGSDGAYGTGIKVDGGTIGESLGDQRPLGRGRSDDGLDGGARRQPLERGAI